MPYITQNLRKYFDECGIKELKIDNPGELNYCITKLVTMYLQGKDLKYQVINDIVGALEGAKQEFYRRIAVPYEMQKEAENGDVF